MFSISVILSTLIQIKYLNYKIFSLACSISRHHIFFFKLNALGYLLKRDNRMYLEIELKKIVMKTVLRLKTFLGHYKLCREI